VSYTYNEQFHDFREDYVKDKYPNIENGRRYQLQSMYGKGAGPAMRFGDRVINPPSGLHFRWNQERIDKAMEEGIIVFPRKGEGMPRFKDFLDTKKGIPLQTIWNDIPDVNSQAQERRNYPTQKPEALLERILKASSNEGDLVLDCFCGSGTTAAVAEKLNRRWITCDLGRFAIHTARKRLLGIPEVRPFVVQNLGKYERQAWQSGEFGDSAGAQRQRAYVEFILEMYRARPLNGYLWLHGVKGGRMVHVGSVDAPVTTGDLTNIAIEFRRAMGSGEDAPNQNGVDVLGWDFAFETNETAKQQAALAGIQMNFKRIPREILEKRAVEQGDIKFFELAALGVDASTQGQTLTLRLSDFVISPDDVPAEIQGAITHWSQWIDYWAVDFDNESDTFHNQWQSYRTRKDGKLDLETKWTYEEKGEYSVVVKVIDILGNDTTKSLKVNI
jgi:hypothetical protein